MTASHCTLKQISGICIVCGILAFADFALPSDMEAVDPPQPSLITVGGAARIYGDWSCRGDATVQAKMGEAMEPLPGFPNGIRLVTVAMPVSNFECNDSIVGNSFRKALKEKEHPEISFEMYSYVLEEEKDEAIAQGAFTIAGVTRNVELDTRLAPIDQNGVIVSGSMEILMTDYGIKPPEALFGLIKVNDNVAVHFDLRIPSSAEEPE